MNQDPQIRRTPDGSIDMSYYLGKGRDCRSRAARGLVARARAGAGKSIGKGGGNRRHVGWGQRPRSTSIEAA